MSENKSNKSSTFKKLRKWIFRTILFFVIFLLFISLAVYIALQFHSVRNYIKETALNYINQSLIAKVEIDDISFSRFGVVQLYGVRLITAGDTLASVKHLLVNPNYGELLKGNYRVRRLELNEPVVKLLRSKQDSLWNYELIAPHSTEPDTVPEPNELLLKVRRLIFNNGKFLMLDSLASPANPEMVDYHHFNFVDLNLNLSAEVNLGKMDFQTNIRNISFTDLTSGLTINSLKGNAQLNPYIISMYKGEIILNEHTKLYFGSNITNFNVFDIPDIEKAIFDFNLYNSEIDFDVLKYFTELPIEIKGINEFDLVANGTLEELNINKLKLQNGDLFIDMSGETKELLNMDKFSFKTNLDGSKIPQNEVSRILPSLDLSSVPQLGLLDLQKLYVQGNLDTIWTELDISAGATKLKGQAGIGNFENELTYNAELSFNNLNLETFTQNSELKSNITGEIILIGQGIDYRNMNSNIQLNLNNNTIADIKIDELILDAEIAPNSIIKINNLITKLPNYYETSDIDDIKYLEYYPFAEINLNGVFDAEVLENPTYDFKLDIQNLNLAEYFKNEHLPYNLSNSLTLSGKGIHPDSLHIHLLNSFDQLTFQDRSMMPFDIEIDIYRLDDIRDVSIKSNKFNIGMQGEFLFSDLINSVKLQGVFLSDFLQEQFSGLIAATKEEETIDTTQINFPSFPNINANIYAEIDDFYLLSIFLDDIDIESKLKLNFNLLSDGYESNLKIDSISISQSQITFNDKLIKTEAISFSGDLRMLIVDSIPTFDYFKINLTKNGRIELFQIEDYITRHELLIIENPKLILNYDGHSIKYNLGGIFNNHFGGSFNGSLIVSNNILNLSIDSLFFNYDNKFQWYNNSNIEINISPDMIDILSFELARQDKETINVNGKLINQEFQDVKLTLNNFPISDLFVFAPIDLQRQLLYFNSNIDTLNLSLNGEINNPKIDINLKLGAIRYSNYNFGRFTTNLHWYKNKLTGSSRLYKPDTQSDYDLMNIEIRSFPLDLGLLPETELKPQVALNIISTTKNFPLALASPFVPGIRNLSGTLNTDLEIFGDNLENFGFKGEATITNSKFLIEATNMEYTANASMRLNNEKLDIYEINVRNIAKDSQLGRATGKGAIFMNNLDISGFDFQVNANRFKVLSDATQYTMPWLYGDMLISTDSRPIRFYGTFDEPSLSGDINIIRADLKMPQIQTRETARSLLQYEVKDETIRFVFSDNDTNNNGKDETTHLTKEFADLINYDLSIKFLGQFAVTMDIGALGSMYAIIGTTDRNRAIYYRKNRTDAEAEFIGELEVKDGSSLRSFRLLQTSGNIYFTTGSIENPNLDLLAVYNGTTYEDGIAKSFSVTMKITGTPTLPIVDFTYSIDGVDAVGDKKRIEQDALMLLVTGNLRGGSGGGDMPNLQQLQLAAGSGVVSQYGSQLLTNFLMTTGFIQSANIDFRTDNIDETTVKLSGQILGNVTWTVGGSISDITGNNQIIVDVPLSNFFENELFRNFVIQFSKDMNQNTTTTTHYRESKYWEVKFKFGGSY